MTVAEVGFEPREKSSTFSASAAEVLPRKSPEGAYTAVIECMPMVSELVFNEAWPVLSRVTVPSAVVPSLKVTDPVGTVELAGTVATAAVNVTEPPAKAGFTSAESAVLVAICGATVKRYALIEPMIGLLPKPPIIEVAS